MTEILTGIIGILMFLFLCIFTNIPKGLYYEALYHILDPRIWSESVVISGSKPEEVQIKGTIIFRRCDIYKSDRIYKYKAEDLGTSYRLELPVINKDNSCQRKVQISVNTVGNPYERYYTGWTINTYNYLKSSWNSPTEIIQNTSVVSLNCPSKGICYYKGKDFKDMSEKLKEGTIRLPTVSQENLNSLTRLTINFGK